VSSRDRLMPWSGTGSWVTGHAGHGSAERWGHVGHGSQNVTHCQLCCESVVGV